MLKFLIVKQKAFRICNSAASCCGLRIGVVWFGIGISLLIAHTIWVSARFRGKGERVLFEGPYEWADSVDVKGFIWLTQWG